MKQTYVKPQDDWIRIEGSHEAIVSARDFEIVQRLLGMDTRTSPEQDKVYLLAGIAVCAECGAPMTRKISTVSEKKYVYYMCSNYKETKRCSNHRISGKDLEEMVFQLLRQHIQNVVDLKKILEFIGTVPFQELNVKKLQERLEKKEKELERCRELRTMLYSDMKDGIVSKEDYVELHDAYGRRMKNAGDGIRSIRKEMKEVLEATDSSNVWLDYFTKHKDMKELTRTVVVELISKVAVHDRHNIEITFDCDDAYHSLISQLNASGTEVSTKEDGSLEIHMREAV